MRTAWICLLVGPAAVAVSPVAAEESISRVTPVVRAYRSAGPAVVNISAEKIVTTRWGGFGGAIFEDIFPSPYRRRVPVQSLGSGFLIHPAGYIVTNDHVVRRAQKITVNFADKSQLPARVISTDPSHDLAVVKVEAPAGRSLPYLRLGRSDDLMVGETVIAIGNPLGYSHSVTRGIVSALNRKLEFREGVAYGGLIQTDAPINPGSSGGPLLSIRGELIGINTAIRADAQNIGFAIPVDSLMTLLPELLDFERINRVIFGAKVLQRHTAGGDELYVAAVRAGTPAAGKLRVGDRLVAVGGRPVRQIPDFVCALLAVKAPSRVPVKGVRDGKDFLANVPVQVKPRPNGKLLAEKLFGMTLGPITPQTARRLRLPLDSGLLVVGIDEGSPADRIGLRLRDVIFQVGRLYVTDLGTLGMVLEDVRPSDVIKVGVVRGNYATWVPIRARQASAPSGSGRGSP